MVFVNRARILILHAIQKVSTVVVITVALRILRVRVHAKRTRSTTVLVVVARHEALVELDGARRACPRAPTGVHGPVFDVTDAVDTYDDAQERQHVLEVAACQHHANIL